MTENISMKLKPTSCHEYSFYYQFWVGTRFRLLQKTVFEITSNELGSQMLYWEAEGMIHWLKL